MNQTIAVTAAFAWLASASLARAQATAIVNLSGFGQPLQAIQNEAPAGASADLRTFATGQLNFTELETLPSGLGPIFNSRACSSCHFQPAMGGSGGFFQEVRVRNNLAEGPLHMFAVNNMLRLGPQTQGAGGVFPQGVEAAPLGCQITAPGCQQSACQKEEAARTTFATNLPICNPVSSAFATGANCTAERQATPLFGLGLVEAVSDLTLISLAASEQASARGVVKQVSELGATHAARFGWKDDHAVLRAFASDAYANEIGITNPDRPEPLSLCAMGQTQFGVVLQTADDPEDTTDTDGRADIDRFADFLRGLAPPPQLTLSVSAMAGSALFTKIGCAQCHTPVIKTASNPASFIPPTTGGVPISPSLNRILTSQTFHPFSDFLLHDMGSLGDGITSGAAGPTMMRTAPLWGVRAKSELLHDGRAADIPTAISLHDGQGKAAAQAFGALSSSQQQSVINFLNSI